ncbi:MAG: integron integrase [Granulosicoccaceae bacterium]
MGHFPRLFDQVRRATREHRLSYRAEQAYVMWVQQFIHFHDCTHPQDLGPLDVEAFLSHLVLDRNVAPSAQSQALSAIVFLYTYVQLSPPGDHGSYTKATSAIKNKQRKPATFSTDEATAVLSELKNPYRLITALMYGSGLRLMESLRLRVKDIDFHRGSTNVRDGKTGKDRTVALPDDALLPLKKQIGLARCIHDEDLANGCGRTVLPHSLARKYGLASSDFDWQLVFPSVNRSLEPRSGVIGRHHLPEQSVQLAVRSAIIEASRRMGDMGNIDKHASCHTFRHSFATHSLQRGVAVHLVQKQLGHSDVSAMQIYAHSIQGNDSIAAHPLKTA